MIVEISPPGASVKEFVIVELQGELQVRRGEKLEAQTLGVLKFKNGKPTMVIGNQLAEGKLEKLSKPQAVMVRADAASSGAAAAVSTEEEATAWTVGGAASPAWLRVVGMVRHKVVFGKRPQPIISTKAV